MNKQTAIEAGSLHSAMALAFAEIEGATKAATNPHFKSKYADLGAVIDAVKPPLIAHGLFFTQHPQPAEGGIAIETMLHHSSGESLSLGTLFVPANRQDPQGYGSALTYARRYALQTAFGVPAEDDDGNRAVEGMNRPTTGETPPAKRVPLAGPYTSKTALWKAVREFAHTSNGIADLGEYVAFIETEEVKELLAQCARDEPGLLRDGLPAVPEYEPLEIHIDRRKRELEEIENIHNTPNVLRAG